MYSLSVKLRRKIYRPWTKIYPVFITFAAKKSIDSSDGYGGSQHHDIHMWLLTRINHKKSSASTNILYFNTVTLITRKNTILLS